MSNASNDKTAAAEERAHHTATASRVIAQERDRVSGFSPAPDLFHLLCADHDRLMHGGASR